MTDALRGLGNAEHLYTVCFRVEDQDGLQPGGAAGLAAAVTAEAGGMGRWLAAALVLRAQLLGAGGVAAGGGPRTFRVTAKGGGKGGYRREAARAVASAVAVETGWKSQGRQWHLRTVHITACITCCRKARCMEVVTVARRTE